MPAFERRHFFRIITTPHLLLQKPVSKEFVIDAVSAQILRDEVFFKQSLAACTVLAVRRCCCKNGREVMLATLPSLQMATGLFSVLAVVGRAGRHRRNFAQTRLAECLPQPYLVSKC